MSLHALLRLPISFTPGGFSLPTQTCIRTITSTSALAVRGFANPELGKSAYKQPPYPHGAERFYQAANRGLYGHVRKRTGNNVSERNEGKTRRRWYPNVHNKRLWSESLQRFIRVRVVIRVLRTIDKAGGLDSYLLGQTPGRVKEMGPVGWALRWRILRTAAGKERWEEERRKLGLTGVGPRDQGWMEMGSAKREGGEVVEREVLGADVMEERMVEEGEMEVADAQGNLEAREREMDRELDEREVREEAVDLTQETADPKMRRGWFS